jgi:glutamate 5-kinase
LINKKNGEMKIRYRFKNIDCVVIKVGTRVLTGSNNLILRKRIDRLAEQIIELNRRGISTVLVTSGAVGAGMGRIGIKGYPRLIPERQAVAAVGQVQLMKMWEHAFDSFDKLVAQVLVTAGDFQNRRRFVNLQNTFESLLRIGVIPVVNENDSVAVKELQYYGDNDILSTQVAGIVGARILIILSDIDGVYTDNPQKNPDAERLSLVENISPELLRATRRGKGSEVSIGGMRSKIRAASLAIQAGHYCVIASGEDCSLVDLIEGRDVGTLFLPQANSLKRRKAWIAYTSRPRGKLIVDQGARLALTKKQSSLLSSGIKDILGRFDSGDVVEITCSEEEEPFAKGVSSYTADDLARIKGLHSSQIEEVLGHVGPDEVVHKDNLVLLKPSQ